MFTFVWSILNDLLALGQDPIGFSEVGATSEEELLCLSSLAESFLPNVSRRAVSWFKILADFQDMTFTHGKL